MSESQDFKFELGQNVKDIVTGVVGVITGRAEWITGCDQYVLQPKCSKDGAHVESRWFDEGRLSVEKKGHIDPADCKGKIAGGPNTYMP